MPLLVLRRLCGILRTMKMDKKTKQALMVCVPVVMAILVFMRIQVVGLSIETLLEALFYAVILLLAIGMYFLPFIIAVATKKKDRNAIGALNALAGWLVIGWFAALIWALVNEKEEGEKNTQATESTQATE